MYIRLYESSYARVKNKINKLYDKCNNVRNDFLHKLSTSIINENQVIKVGSFLNVISYMIEIMMLRTIY